MLVEGKHIEQGWKNLFSTYCGKIVGVSMIEHVPIITYELVCEAAKVMLLINEV